MHTYKTTSQFIGRLIAIVFMLSACFVNASSHDFSAKISRDISYANESSPDAFRRLDVYLPAKTQRPLTALIWFHGGGLTSGSKDEAGNQAFAKFWQAQGIALIQVNYRLNPTVSYPTYIEDAAAAVSWVFEHAARLGIDTHHIYVGGHSAGAYLTNMVALDNRYLSAHNIQPKQIAGYISLSGQMSTHFTVRKEQNLNESALVVTEAAPFFYIKAEAPKILLLIGDNDWPARLEENQLAYAQFKQIAKTDQVSFSIIHNRTHTSIFENILREGDETATAIKQFMALP